MEFKIIKEFPSYKINEVGTIINKHGKILKSKLDRYGYHRIGLYKNEKQFFRMIHRLVAQTFILNPQNKETVNHINAIKTDNRVENLEWTTISEQMIHAHKVGMVDTKGERNGQSKLKIEQVKEIKRLLAIDTQKHIASLFNVSRALINHIANNKNWIHV